MDGAIGADGDLLTGQAQPEEAAAGVLLAGRYRALPERRLEHFDSPRASAYAVIDDAEPAAELFCLVSPIEALPRTATARALQTSPLEGMLTPLAVSHCRWPPLGRTAAAFVFRPPGGSRLAPGMLASLSTAELARRVLAPLARALSALAASGLTHRAIRADNLFWADVNETEVVLGECVSAAAGADQPAPYEPLTRMTAMPPGRGPGSAEDDLYALGVTIIDLVNGLCGADGYPPGLVLRKLEQGSLAGLLPQASPAPELSALLRGLLTDDPERRWSTRHLSRWLTGERTENPPPVALLASQRPLALGKSRFRNARSLAHGVWRDRDQAIPLLRDGTIERWLRTSLRDPRLAAGIAREVNEAARKAHARRLARDILLERCCKLLDPGGPVRFGGIAAMPDAYGTVLGSLVLQQAPTADFQGLLRAVAADDLLLAQPAGDDGAAAIDLNGLLRLLDGGGLGGGIARCLYDLNPDLPCLSPLLTAAVNEIRDLLMALDRRAAELAEGSALVDVHAAAFIASKLALTSGELAAMAQYGSDRSFGTRKQLRLLALAQARSGPAALPALARAAAVGLSPVVRALRNRDLRKRLAAAMAECVERGDLSGMIERIDDAAMWQRDRAGFTRAQREFAAYSRELERLADPGRSGLSRALDEGRRLSAFISLSVAVAILSCLLLVA